MLQNYLTIATRYLLKNRTYAAINIFGLAVGICACLLLFRLVRFELGFNRNFKNADRIVRVVTRMFNASEGENFDVGLPIPAMDAVQQSVPQFEKYARVHSFWPTVNITEKSGAIKKFVTDDQRELAAFVEPDFLLIFDFKWLNGDPSVLGQPSSIVLSKRWADKCFGNWQASLGQTMLIDNLLLVTVRGVIEDPVSDCDFPFNFLLSYEDLKRNADALGYRKEWGSTSSNDQAFGLLQSKDQFAAAENVLKLVGQKEYKQNRGDEEKVHFLQPLSEMHFDERLNPVGGHMTSRSRLAILSAIALLILAMACFNFINLATAQAAGRAREVGVRKTLGSNRSDLIRQFLGETTLIVTLAVGLGALLAAFLKPQLKNVSEVPDDWPFMSDPLIWGVLLLLILVLSLVSGFYPAIVLSRFDPAKALKNDISARTVGGLSLRKVLVVSQFLIAQALIIGTIVVVAQMSYIREKDLGFKSNLVYNVIGIPNDSIGLTKMDYLKQQFLKIPGVKSVSFSSDTPISGNTSSTNFAMSAGGSDAPFNTNLKFVDADYFKTYQLRMVAGQPLSVSDTVKEVVVNQTMLRKSGINDPASVIGTEMRIGGGRRMVKIAGVVEDFNLHSVHDPIVPVAILSRKSRYYMAGLQLESTNVEATIAQIRNTFDATFPEQYFYGKFLDETIAEFYLEESRFSSLCKGFALLAVLISCLGLFGLAAHMARQRTKEIGVRKVLGATVGSITGLLASDFLKLVLIAIVVATPIAYFIMQKWLNNFAYRIDLQWWMFAVAGGIAILVAFATVSFQSIKAALANPVDSIKRP